MAKSTSTKGKGKAVPTPRAPSPVPSVASSSASPSSSSDSDSDSDSSSSTSGRGSSASPAPEQPSKQLRVDPSTQKYAPPEGFKAVRVQETHEGLDWDAINEDKELELWAVRVPAGLKAKYLDKLTLTLPPSDVTSPSQPVGTLQGKNKTDYNVYLAPGAASSSSSSSSSKRKRDEPVDEASTVPGAGELQTLVPLLPRKKEGNKLFQAPRPIAHTLLISRALPPSVLSFHAASRSLHAGHSTLIISQPSPVPGALLTSEELLNPSLGAAKKAKVLGKTGRTQPEELLKFRLDLPGNKAVGGEGKWSHGASEEEMESLRRGVLTPFSFAEGIAFDGGAAEEEQQQEEGAEDVEMGEAQVEQAEGVEAPAAVEEEVVKPKKEKKSKKEKVAGEEKTPKKKKVKTEA